MRRREFIAFLGGAAMWPLAARARQSSMPVIGFLHSASAADFPEQLAGFRDGLQKGGYVEGQNLAIAYRWAEGKFDRLAGLARELVELKVAAIAATGGVYSIRAAKTATSVIPIIFSTGADPVKMGLVSSLNHPGENVTGVSFFAEELSAKQLGLVHELVPGVTVVGLLVNPTNRETPREAGSTQEAARTLGMRLEVVDASTPSQIVDAFDSLSRRKVGALLVLADAFFGAHVHQIAELAARHRVPTMFYRSEYPRAGGLMSYGTDINDAYRQVGLYVSRILKGEKPSDLPVMQSTKFEFIINLKTAKTLGLKISDNLLSTADEVIE